MPNMRIATNIWNTTATDIQSSSEANGFQMESVLGGSLNTVWRTDSDINQYIWGDLGQARPINFVAVMGHNFRSDQTLTLQCRIDDVSSFASPAFNVTQDKDDIIGLDGASGPFPALHIFWLPSTITYRYWRLDISQSANPDTYLEVGRILVGEYYEPNYSMDLGYRLIIKDKSRLNYTSDNVLRAFTKPKSRQQVITLSSISATEEVEFNKLLLGHEAFSTAYPESTGELEQQHTVLGVISKDIGMNRYHATERRSIITVDEGSSLGTEYSSVGGGVANQLWLLKSNNLNDVQSITTALANLGANDAFPRRNLLDNASFTVWQRGTSFSAQTADQVTADRWAIDFTQSASETYTVAQGSTSQHPGEGQETEAEDIGLTGVLKLSTSAAHGGILLQQSMEESLLDAVSGLTVAFSVWVYGGSTGITIDRCRLEVDLDNAGAGDSTNNLITGTFTAASTTWARLTGTVTMPTISTTRGSDPTLRLVVGCTSSQSAQLTDVEFAAPKLEIGPTQTRYTPPDPGQELEACMRHYQYGDNTDKGTAIWVGYATNGSIFVSSIYLRPEMYSTPTVSLTNLSATNFPATPSANNTSTKGFEDRRTANGTGYGSFRSAWTAATGW